MNCIVLTACKEVPLQPSSFPVDETKYSEYYQSLVRCCKTAIRLCQTTLLT